MTSYEQQLIEEIVDKYGLMALVDSVCQVCYDKAEHIRTNYQDEVLAKQWDDAGKSLVNPKIEVEFPS